MHGFQMLFPHWLFQDIEKSSLCCSVRPCRLLYVQRCDPAHPKLMIYPSLSFTFGPRKFACYVRGARSPAAAQPEGERRVKLGVAQVGGKGERLGEFRRAEKGPGALRGERSPRGALRSERGSWERSRAQGPAGDVLAPAGAGGSPRTAPGGQEMPRRAPGWRLCSFPAGLCVGQADGGRAEALPKPSLRAWPSSVVPARSSVTLRCGAPTGAASFALRKAGRVWEMVQSPDSAEARAEFHLPDVKSSHAGEYTCEYRRSGDPRVSSRPSDALLLLVTGYLRRPSLQAHRRGAVTEGHEVTLQCQRPATERGTALFALLKAGSAAPVQVRAPAGRETDLSLRNVRAGDSGSYSCVHCQARAPFLASQASPRLESRVAG
ncbi:T-cell-interacting, activating receptor on myeloid cells protein 1 isoform X2 [Moschus berezovskii]|uniref:T-cell-interacting, activating receptor on myeloid cells protein 1 isoform X2 n=1 Tax=Moschus berezovskii TaxID=68408 RepID=UPI002444CF60|nr:T-cell-interacting, activating receptor on myeloid cells protein 1 isoform X2 [Moschus berezovskii]